MSTTTTVTSIQWAGLREGGAIGSSPLGRVYLVKPARLTRLLRRRRFDLYTDGFPVSTYLGRFPSASAAKDAAERHSAFKRRAVPGA